MKENLPQLRTARRDLQTYLTEAGIPLQSTGLGNDCIFLYLKKLPLTQNEAYSFRGFPIHLREMGIVNAKPAES